MALVQFSLFFYFFYFLTSIFLRRPLVVPASNRWFRSLFCIFLVFFCPFVENLEFQSIPLFNSHKLSNKINLNTLCHLRM